MNKFHFVSQHFHRSFNGDLFNVVKASDLIAYMAILLGFFAYKYPIEKEMKSFQILLRNLSSDLRKMNEWLGGQFKKGTFEDKKAYLPIEIWVPVPTTYLNEIVKSSIENVNLISESLAESLIKLNNKIELYNSMLIFEKDLTNQNSALSASLFSKIIDKVKDENCTYQALKNFIETLPSEEKTLSKNLYQLRRERHEDLLGTEESPESTYSIYSEVSEKTGNYLKNPNAYLPVFMRYGTGIFICFTATIFLLIELFFRS